MESLYEANGKLMVLRFQPKPWTGAQGGFYVYPANTLLLLLTQGRDASKSEGNSVAECRWITANVMHRLTSSSK